MKKGVRASGFRARARPGAIPNLGKENNLMIRDSRLLRVGAVLCVVLELWLRPAGPDREDDPVFQPERDHLRPRARREGGAAVGRGRVEAGRQIAHTRDGVRAEVLRVLER